MHPLDLLLTLALVPAAAAQDPGAQDAPAVREAEAPFEKVLLHLEDGRVLRVRARPIEAVDGGGGFQVRAGRDATYEIPAAAVTRVVLEADALREARKLAADVRRDDATRRVALASWMFDQGLFEEGVDELDAILGGDPEQKDALALLERNPPPLALPAFETSEDSVRAYLGAIAGAKPVAREVGLRRLDAVAADLDLQALLAAELETRSVRRRALAAHALRRLYPGAQAKALLTRAVLDGSDDVRANAALALGVANEPALCLPVLRALGSSSSAVRANAAEALGVMGYPHAVAPLVTHLGAVNALAQSGGGYHPPASNIFVGKQIAYVQDFDVEVAQGAVIADPQINTLTEGAVLDVRVLAITQTELAVEKAAVRRALSSLTGAEPGATTQAWLDWWARNGADWTARLGAPTPSPPTTPGG